jgi:hypothetical protein
MAKLIAIFLQVFFANVVRITGKGGLCFVKYPKGGEKININWKTSCSMLRVIQINVAAFPMRSSLRHALVRGQNHTGIPTVSLAPEPKCSASHRLKQAVGHDPKLIFSHVIIFMFHRCLCYPPNCHAESNEYFFVWWMKVVATCSPKLIYVVYLFITFDIKITK